MGTSDRVFRWVLKLNNSTASTDSRRPILSSAWSLRKNCCMVFVARSRTRRAIPKALERKTGYVETDNGKIVRGFKSTYKRHGTLNLFAALEVATGAIHTETTEKKRRIEFLEFMDHVVAELPDSKEIHVILDNYSIHKKNDAWLAAHPNVSFHFTPTSASWLNQVEIWFGIMSRKALPGASFRSVIELRQAIEAFVAAYGPKAKPFVWRKREVKGSQLRNTIVNLRN